MFNLLKGNKSLSIIALVAIVNSLGYAIVIPVLYSYSVKFGLSDFQNGLLFALFSICQFAATPLIGRLSDKYGRRPLLVISLIGTAVSFFMTAFAPNVFFLFLARALDGITAGNIPVAMAVIADTTEEHERARGFGIIAASFGFGFVIGPAIAAATVGISAALPFIIAGVFTTIAVFLTYFLLPETNKHIGQVHEGKLFDFGKMIRAAFDPNVGKTLVITLFYFMAFFLFIYAFQPYMVKVLHLSPVEISLLFTGFGAVGLVSQLFLVQKVVQMFGLKRAFTTAFLVVAICFGLLFFAKVFLMFIIIIFILGFANSLVQPLLTTIISKETDAKSQGTILGLNSSYMSVGQILGPILGGAFATISLGLPFVAAGATVIFCFYLAHQVMNPKIKKDTAF